MGEGKGIWYREGNYGTRNRIMVLGKELWYIK